MGDDVNDLIANGWRLNDEVVAAKRERDEWKARAETAERDLTAARQALTDAERERDEARARVDLLHRVLTRIGYETGHDHPAEAPVSLRIIRSYVADVGCERHDGVTGAHDFDARSGTESG